MKEFLVHGDTLPTAYHRALYMLWNYGEETPCETQTELTHQKEVSMTFVVERPTAEPMISRLWIGGAYDLERYRQEMLDGILDFCVGHGWDYTYHHRMHNFPCSHKSWLTEKDQVEFVIDELRRCPHSRRAVITLRSDEDISIDATDPACLQSVQYLIRDGALHCKVLFRSNDAVEATFMNAFALILLQKRIADELGLLVGSYTHRANSFHCYEKDYKILAGYVRRISSGENLTYEYAGEFDEMMEEERDAVDELVRHQREKLLGWL